MSLVKRTTAKAGTKVPKVSVAALKAAQHTVELLKEQASSLGGAELSWGWP